MRKSTKLLCLLFALILITSIFITATVARYITLTTNQEQARVVAWGINAGTINMDLFSNQYKLENGVIIAKSNDGDNIIAPGLSGLSKFNIVTANASIKPEVMYEIIIDVNDSEIDQMILDNPSIEWKLDNNQWGTWEETKFDILALSGDVTGRKTYAPGTVATEFANGNEHTIAWQWIADAGNNEMDTLMGNEAIARDISALISINITARQTEVAEMEMLDGNFTTYNSNDPEPVVFRADGNIEDFTSVEVNDVVIGDTNYTVTDGSIKVTLKESYLETLNDGDYIITINAGNKKSNGIFNVKSIVVPPSLPDEISYTLAENSWETISQVAKCGKASEYWSVGDKTTVMVGEDEYKVMIIGMDHDGDNTITFLFYESVAKGIMNDENTNSGSWKNSKMRNVTIPAILGQMENKELIISVEKETSVGYADVTNDTYTNSLDTITTNDKLFLLSYTEIFGICPPEGVCKPYVEGQRYEYFNTNSAKIPNQKYGLDYWLRTPDYNNIYNFAKIFETGTCDTREANSTNQILPAFVVGG
jgi:hypothetical protein